MAINFNKYPAKYYIGTPYSIAAPLFSNSGRVIPLNFNWQAYGVGTSVPNLVILLNLQGGSNRPLLNAIRSIYIDNLASQVPIFVQFKDTLCTVVAQPNSEGWYNVFTNSVEFIVAGLGFNDQNLPITSIFISNSFVPPNVAVSQQFVTPLLIGSNTVQNANTAPTVIPGFGPPALGDQTIQFVYAMTNSPFDVVLPTQASGFYYITSYVLNSIDLANATRTEANLEFISDQGNHLFSTFMAVPSLTQWGNDVDPIHNLMNLQGMNVRIPANRNWGLQVDQPVGQGSCQLFLNYTFSQF